jgi:hypothetical protein
MVSGNHTHGRAVVTAIRWHECARPGEYVVNIAAAPREAGEWTYWHDVPGYSQERGFDFMANFRAVVDDFGRLVRVQ